MVLAIISLSKCNSFTDFNPVFFFISYVVYFNPSFMNILYYTISQLNREEVRVVNSYLERNYQEGTHRKDLSLLEKYRQSKNEPADEIISLEIGYPAKEMNAFYRLKNRLLTDINKVLSMRQSDNDPYAHTLEYLSLFRYHRSKEHIQLAAHYLKKAEKTASEGAFYDLLDTIFGEWINLSQQMLEINPESYVKKRAENLEKLDLAREIDQIISVLNYRLKITQNVGKGKEQALDIYARTLDEFTRDPKLSGTPQFRIRIYKAVSRILVQKQDFTNLETFLVRNFDAFEKEGLFNRTTHEVKVEMLIYLVNTLNALKKFTTALEYCHKLRIALEEFGKLMYQKYSYFYYQGLVGAYASLDPAKAIEELHKMLDNKDFTVDQFYDIFIYSNLAICYATMKDYHASLKHLNKVYMQDLFEKTGLPLKLRLYCYEMIARYELGDLDTIEYKLDRWTKDLRNEPLFKESREGKFLILMKMMAKGIRPKEIQVVKVLVDEIAQSADEDLLIQWIKGKR